MNVPVLRFSEFSGEWEIKKVGDICDAIVSGRNKPIEFNGDIPWITTPDIEQNGIIYFSKKNLNITKEEAKNVGSKIVPKNSIVISCVGELGLAAIAGIDLIINQQLHAFIPKKNIYFRFLLYALTIQKPYMEKVATKTAVPYMNKDNCNSIPVIFPSISEQTKIADFLTQIDNKINQLSQKKQLLERYKKGVMQQIFSQAIRFKDDDGRKFPEWEEKEIGEVFYDNKGYGLSKEKLTFNGKHKCILYGELFTTYAEIIRGIKSSTNFDEGVKSKIGDILLPSSTTTKGIDLAKASSLNEENVMLGGDIIILRFKNIGYSNYFSYYLTHAKNREISEITQGITIIHLYFKQLSKIKIDVPSLPEQTKIANFLTALDNKIALVEKQLNGTKQYKKGLLQQLFV